MVCSGCAPTYFQTIKDVFNNDNAALEIFKNHGVVPRQVTCPTCGNNCFFKKSSRSWYCEKVTRDKRSRKRKCSFSVSSYKGTWLANSHVKPSDNFIFIGLFLSKSQTQRDAEDWLNWTSATVVNWKNFCYEVCEFWFGQQPPIGGPGRVVEINESKFGKSNYSPGCKVKGTWVFGAIERDTKKLLLFPVRYRDHDSLVGIIKQCILPGTTIYSDGKCTYNTLSDEGYVHHTVNHSKEFVSSSGVHTQTIYRAWRDVKSWVLRSGNKTKSYPKYIARYLFNREYPRNERLHHFLRVIAELYQHPYAAVQCSEYIADDSLKTVIEMNELESETTVADVECFTTNPFRTENYLQEMESEPSKLANVKDHRLDPSADTKDGTLDLWNTGHEYPHTTTVILKEEPVNSPVKEEFIVVKEEINDCNYDGS